MSPPSAAGGAPPVPCAPGPCRSPPSFVAVKSSLSPPRRDPVAEDVRHAALRRGGGKSLFPLRGFFLGGGRLFLLSPPRASRGLEWGRSSQSCWAVLGPHPCVSVGCPRELGAWRCPRVEAVSVQSLPAGRWSSAQAAAAQILSCGHSKVSSPCVTGFPCVGARRCHRAPPCPRDGFGYPTLQPGLLKSLLQGTRPPEAPRGLG